jgi:acetylornithine/N-succinyldiaminopimelate aminotransferase
MQNPNSGFTYSPVRAKLLLQLQPLLPAGLHRVFFANSGAEANDAAVKLARKVTGRERVLAANSSFHGRTLATLSLSVSSSMQATLSLGPPSFNPKLHSTSPKMNTLQCLKP